jgi:hypothetical protein
MSPAGLTLSMLIESSPAPVVIGSGPLMLAVPAHDESR